MPEKEVSEPSNGVEFSPYEINPTLTKWKAKELYMCAGWEKDQLLELGIPEGTLNAWLYTETEDTLPWKIERDNHRKGILYALKEEKAETLKSTLSHAVSMVRRSLAKADMEGKDLSPREMKDVMGVIKDINNMIQLEEGKPTSIKAEFEYNEKNVRKLLEDLDKLDPLMDYDAKNKIN